MKNDKIILKSLVSLGLTMIVLMGAGGYWESSARGSHIPVDIQKAGLIGPAKPAAQADIDIVLEPVISGFNDPVQVTHAGDGSGRLFVVQQGGLIRIIKNGAILGTPFLDVSGLICCGEPEQGLLGLTFDPDYKNNGYFYINYTSQADPPDVANDGDTVVARYSVSGNPDIADPNSDLQILTIGQPFINHNGGQLVFGPDDGYLYIGMGDGGGSNDPNNNGQNKNVLLGKMLRIDVANPAPDKNYGIPSDNPYVGVDGADEVWATGLRNPWRFSFDRVTHDLYIGDVGQGLWEEIDFQAAGTPGGLNFGWDIREGPCPPGDPLPCAAAPAGFTEPIAFYDHSDPDPAPPNEVNRSVTGGFVYRGSLYPRLKGYYFYADYVTGRIWSITQTGPNSWSTPVQELNESFLISSFGEDEQGELYVVQYAGGTSGRILRLADANGPSSSLDESTKTASVTSADPGEAITYTIHIHNSGVLTNTTAFLTDTIPAGLGYVPSSLAATSGTVDASLAPATLRWQGPLSPTRDITITYVVTATGVVTGSLTNVAQLTSAAAEPVTLTHTIQVPKLDLIYYLPVIFKQ